MIVVHGFNFFDTAKKLLNKGIAQGSCVTIGNFDGIHLGHQAVFNQLFTWASYHNLIKVCITFEPSAKEYINKKNGVDTLHTRLTTCKDKLKLLQNIGFDLVWVINFNKNTMNLDPAVFLSQVAKTVNLKYLIIGNDFKFGKDRKGDISFLKENANQYKYMLETAKDFLSDNQRISSSLIKKINYSSWLDNVRKLLGRYYGFSGKVIYGQQRGRLIGFPTANIHVKSKQLLLPTGVYAVLIRHQHIDYKAMANWGVRPTVAQKLDLVLEAHIFDFDKELYGQEIYIEFIKYIRPERKFASIDDLKNQLTQDEQQIRTFYQNL